MYGAMTERRSCGGPLQGVRVLDLTRLLPGPMASLHLADLGADVIKIEDTGIGDYARTLGKPRDSAEDSPYFRAINRNKRGMTLDLKQPDGRAVFLDLVKTADVVLESFRPGVMDRLGVGYEVLRGVNPRLVYCAITGYGQTGPMAALAGHDINYIAMSGVLNGIGVAGGAPAIPNFQLGDLMGGTLTAVSGILAALLEVRSGGEGRLVDVSMTDSVLAHSVFSLQALALGQADRSRGDELLTGALPTYGVYETRDGGYMAVGALEYKFWEIFCRTMGHPEWIERYTLEVSEDSERLKQEVAREFAGRDRAEWEARFAQADCCVTPVLSFAEALEHSQTQARGMSFHANGVRQLGLPFALSDFELEVRRPAPGVGQHDKEILAELGRSTEDVARLRASGVISGG